MNAHPDVATAVALDTYRQRLRDAMTAQRIRQAESYDPRRSPRRHRTTLGVSLLTVSAAMRWRRAAAMPPTVTRNLSR